MNDATEQNVVLVRSVLAGTEPVSR